MKTKLAALFCTFCFIMPFMAFAELPLGEAPPQIVLEGDDGGRLDGSAWKSSELTGTVFIVIYADPDEGDTTDYNADAIKKMKLPEGKTKSIAIINMDATWYPNSIIASKLEDYQKEYKDTLYIKDMKKMLVKKWNLKDDSSDIVVVAPDGKVIFSRDGKLSDEDKQVMKAAILKSIPSE